MFTAKLFPIFLNPVDSSDRMSLWCIHSWKWVRNIFSFTWEKQEILLKMIHVSRFLIENRQFQRLHCDILARLRVRFYRDKIVDFQSNLYIINITGKRMISFMFCPHQIYSSTCLRAEPLPLSYSLFFNGLYLFSSIKRHEPSVVEEDRTLSILSQLPFSWRFFRFLWMLIFWKKLIWKSSVLTIYHDIPR